MASGESKAILNGLAESLGLRQLSKETKSELISRIATRIENQRGYRMLRGNDSESKVMETTTGPAAS